MAKTFDAQPFDSADYLDRPLPKYPEDLTPAERKEYDRLMEERRRKEREEREGK